MSSNSEDSAKCIFSFQKCDLFYEYLAVVSETPEIKEWIKGESADSEIIHQFWRFDQWIISYLCITMLLLALLGGSCIRYGSTIII